MQQLSLLKKFSDIYDITEDMKSKEKGDLFELFTLLLFKLDPRLNNKLSNIWLYHDIPINIIHKLELPSKDKGIDLIAVINDEYYAIQCKFRQNPNMIVNWSELSTFFGLSFGINDKIKKGYFVTNTINMCNEVTKSKKVISISGNYFDNLNESFFENIKSEKISFQLKYPFDYQKECIDKAWIHFNYKNRCYVEMACGVGKTLLSYWLDSKMNNKKTIIFVPSLQLLSQFYSDYVNQNYAENRKFDYLLIGSDADINEDTKQKTDGLILSIDPKQIRKHILNKTVFEKDNKEYIFKQKLVIICTYQSADKLIEASKDIEYDFGIYDEAHKTVGNSDKMFGLTLYNKKIHIKKRFFMTATPKIYNGKFDDEEIVSMSNTKIYGKKLYTYNTGRAISEKRLVDYQILSIISTNTHVQKDIKTNKLVNIHNKMNNLPANYLGCILILLKKIHDGTISHLITYHNKIIHSKEFSKYLNKINKILYPSEEQIYIEYLDGKHSMTYRNKVIKCFTEHTKSIICSSRVLNEGVNILAVDSVCFVDVRLSTIDIIQCIGRSLRLYKDKKRAYIIVPTFITNIDDEYDNEKYGNLIRILKALKNTDDGVLDYFCTKDQKIDNSRKICNVECYNTKVVDHVDIDINKWYDNVETKAWKVIDNWSAMYDSVKKWINKHDELPSTKEKKLWKWCAVQRKDYKSGILSVKRQQYLESLKNWFWATNLENINMGASENEIKKIKIEKMNNIYGKSMYLGVPVIIMLDNNYINATKLCKQVNEKKSFKEWKRTQFKNKYYDMVSKNTHIKMNKLEFTNRTSSDKNLRGSYVHPLLIPSIMSWASEEFAVKISTIINSITM